MAEEDDVIELLEEENYYAILNVSKEATIEDVKTAYHRLCKLYHPDRHVDPGKKEYAVKLFNKLQRAYEVLNNADQRAIYDIYGKKGLDAGWEIIERRRTPDEIREEYERLQRQKEEERLQRRTNPKGTIVIGVDGTNIFESYDDYSGTERTIPNIEINKMTINQSIEAPITASDTATLSGNLTVQNGTGSGHVTAGWRRVMSSRSWGEIEYSAGNGPMLHFKAFRNVTKSCHGTIGLAFHSHKNGLAVGVQAMVARQLNNSITGYITWKGGSGSSLHTSLVKETEKGRLQVGVQLGLKNCFSSLTYQYKLDVDTRLKTSIRFGVLGSHFSYGVEQKISKHSNLGATIAIGIPSGVTLKIRLNRASQSFVFPVYLSDSISPMAVFYGTVTPLLLYWSVTTLVIKPFLAKLKEKEAKESQEKHAEKLASMKRDAEQCVELMRESYEQCIERERQRHGLVIVHAWYGNFVSFNENDLNNPYRVNKVIDVVIPLQCHVKSSKLFLAEGSKAQINGFYDPCIGEDKSLRVRYLFRDAVHEVTIAEKEILRIPKQSHRLSSTST